MKVRSSTVVIKSYSWWNSVLAGNGTDIAIDAEELLPLKEFIRLVSYWALASATLAIREDSDSSNWRRR